MAEWRFGRGWTEDELRTRLEHLKKASRNFPAQGSESQSGSNWSRYYSESVISYEPAGPPTVNGPFELAWKAITEYQFSDPGIVTGHFDGKDPLQNRSMLLEIKIFGLHYLCGVRIGAVRKQADDAQTVYRFRYDTLEGHIEVGSEWFSLTKNHESGEISFRISASWRTGKFPNWWSRVGFEMFSHKYQLAWHRLAYLRLRELVGNSGRELVPVPRDETLFHTGAEITNSDLWILNEPSASERVREASTGKSPQDSETSTAAVHRPT